MQVKDKVAIITGSGQGIGRGIAEYFAQEGARVVVNDINQESLHEAEKIIQSHGGEVLAVQADVSKSDEVARMFDEVLARFGTVDVLVNNAAWATPTAHFLEMTEDFWDTVLRINLKSVFLCSQRAALTFADQKKPGAIVNISSFGAARGHREMVAYDAAKGGIEAATRSMAMDLAPWNIRVNAVGPGITETPAVADYLQTPEKRQRMVSGVPLERMGQPADIGAAVVFFASDAANYITGQILYVDGGVVAQLRPAAFERHHKRPD